MVLTYFSPFKKVKEKTIKKRNENINKYFYIVTMHAVRSTKKFVKFHFYLK